MGKDCGEAKHCKESFQCPSAADLIGSNGLGNVQEGCRQGLAEEEKILAADTPSLQNDTPGERAMDSRGESRHRNP